MSGSASRTTATSRALADDPVASRIRALRLAAGWSLKRLSEETGGLAPSFLFNIENGRKVPSEDVATRIAVALGDGPHEAMYRAWALAKSRGRTGRTDHDAMLRAWELLRNAFSPDGELLLDGHGMPPAAIAPAAPADPALDGAARDSARDHGRLRVPVLASAVDPGDAVRPPAEMVINTLSLDPQLYGHDAEQARERFARLRRPFAFPLEDGMASRANLPQRSLAVVTREALETLDPFAAYVLRRDGRLEVLTGSALSSRPEMHGMVIGRIDLLLPDVRR